MYQKIKIKATPKIARRLLVLSQQAGLAATDDVRNLAEQEIIQREDLGRYGLTISEAELRTIRTLDDTNGRGILLDHYHKAFSPAMLYVWLRNKFPLLIVTNSIARNEFVDIVGQLWPEKKVLVWGGYQKTELRNLPPNFIVGTEVEPDVDIFFIRSGNLHSSELLKKRRFSQAFVSSNMFRGSVTERSISNLKGLCIETVGVCFITEIKTIAAEFESRDALSKKTSKEIFKSIKWNTGRNYLISQTLPMLFGHDTFRHTISHSTSSINSAFAVTSDNFLNHLAANDISNNPADWCNVLSIFTDLVV